MTCTDGARAFLDERTGDAALHCDPAQPGLAQLMEEDLAAASAWLAGLGFRAPAVARPASGPYPFTFTTDADTMVGGGYNPGDRSLTLSPGFLRMSGRWEVLAEAARRSSRNREGAPVHEVFHGVQLAYYDVDEGINPYGLPPWIMEGTAEWVGQAWAERKGFSVAYGRRPYDVPLHEPAPDVLGAYQTAEFWRFVGTYLESTDGVAYLRDVFERRPASNTGLEGVDAALRALNPVSPDGLADVFPAFIAAMASGESYATTTSWKIDKAGEKEVSVPVREVAAARTELTVEVPGAPESHTLTISIVNDHEDLHLIVDGKRLDRSSLARNEFRTTLAPGTAPFTVEVVNVARAAEASVRRDVTLRAELEPETTCDSEVYEARAQFAVAGPGGMIEWEGRRVPSPVGQYAVHFPFEPLTITSRGRTFTYYPAAAATDRSKKKVTLFMRTPSFEELAAMRNQPGVEVRGEITTAVPEEPGLDEALYGNVGRGGQLVTDSEARLSPAFSFTLGSGAVMRGAAVTIRLDEMKPGTYTWDGPTLPFERGVSVRGTEFPIPPLNDDVRVTLDELKPGVCARGTFSGGVRYDEGQPAVFQVTGSFYVHAPPEPRR